MQRALKVLLATPLAIAALARADYDSAPWLADLDEARIAFATKYANLEWAVFDRQADLPGLFAQTRERIERARNDDEARAAFDRLARKLGDGHVEFRWPAASNDQAAPETPPRADCAALGYDARRRASPLASLLPGYGALGGTADAVFPAGLLRRGDLRVGVLQIGAFEPQSFPAVCEAALTDLALRPEQLCDDACGDRVAQRATDRMTQALTAQLRALKAAGAQSLLIDITGNGGGTEWADTAARMLTPIPLRAARMEFVRGEHWARNFSEMEDDLRRNAPDYHGADRRFLLDLADQVAARKREALTPCDSAPLWRGEHPACRFLGEGFYASGLLPMPDPRAAKFKDFGFVFKAASDAFTPGVWNGPLTVLVDDDTASAAEEFAAMLQDNRAAIVFGVPTAGAGCGHTNGGTPTTLSHSRGVLDLPDCVRLRADGSNEVTAVQPDVLVGLRGADGPQRRAALTTAKLDEALDRAARLARAVEGNPDRATRAHDAAN